MKTYEYQRMNVTGIKQSTICDLNIIRVSQKMHKTINVGQDDPNQQ